jgi:hypothetical protein
MDDSSGDLSPMPKIELDLSSPSWPRRLDPIPVPFPVRFGASAQPPSNPAVPFVVPTVAVAPGGELVIALDRSSLPERPRGRGVLEAPLAPERSIAAAAARRQAQDMVASGELKGLYRRSEASHRGAYLSGDELAAHVPAVRQNPWEGYSAVGDLTNPLLHEMMEERLGVPGHASERVLFTMGMPATGKTTLCRNLFDEGLVHTVVDSPMGTIEAARRLRALAVDSGRNTEFCLVVRPLGQAVRGMLDRARMEGEGRPVPLVDMADLFLSSARTFRQMADMSPLDERTHLSCAAFDLESETPFRPNILGLEGALRLLERMEREASAGPGGALGELVRHYLTAVQDAEWEGIPYPEEMLAKVTAGLPPGFLEAVGG